MRKGGKEFRSGGVENCYEAIYTAWSDLMERARMIADLHYQIESLTRIPPQDILHNALHVQERKQRITTCIRKNDVNVRQELIPEVLNLYRRFFG